MPPDTSSIETSYSWVRLVASITLSTLGCVGLWSLVVALPALQADFGVGRAGASLLSQGAAMAMEDGLVLAQVLCKDTDIDVALRHYQALRIPRTSRVQLASREQGKKNHPVSRR